MEQLVDTKVKLGKAIPVKEQDLIYWALHIEDYGGSNERCILLTEHEIMNIIPRYSLPREMQGKSVAWAFISGDNGWVSVRILCEGRGISNLRR